VTGELAQRVGEVDHVGVHDEQRLHPVVLEDPRDAVIERVRLALAADLAAQVEHPAGACVCQILGGLGEHDIGGLVGARVIHDVDPQPVLRVVERHQSVDGCPDHEPFVPGGHDHRDVRQVRPGLAVVVDGRVERQHEELVQGRQHGHRPERDEHEQHDLQREEPRLPPVPRHGRACPRSATTRS
jgi:hypothetical protein